VFFLLNGTGANTQDAQYTLSIEILGDDNRSKPAPYAELWVNTQLMKSDAEGRIYFPVSRGSRSVLVKATAAQDYVIVGSGNLGLPSDRSIEIVVTLRKPRDSEKGLAQVVSTLKKMNLNINNLDSLRKADNARYARVMQVQDSLLKVVTTLYTLSETDLRTDLERLKGRDTYYPQITAALEIYLNEAKDIRDAFKQMTDFAMNDPKAILLFDSTIRVYNAAYTVLNSNNNEYERAVLEYWASNELSYGFRNVFDFAINTIHRSEVLHLNADLIPKINQYSHERNKKKRNRIKDEILSTLQTILPRLDNDLTVLETRIRTYLGRLDAQNISLNL
jgi:hypothetical protein